MRSDRNRPLVLVVDDDDGVRTSLGVLLEPEFDPLMADSGPAALEILSARPVDVVLLDIRMPGMDGLAVLRSMKVLNPMVEVILVTGMIDVATAVAAMKLGAFDYVTKPFDDDDLCAKVRGAGARRGEAADLVLLVGSNLGALAAIEVVLEQRGIMATSIAVERALATSASRLPRMILLDTTRSAAQEARTVRSVRQAFPGCPLLVTTPDVAGARLLPDFAAIRPWALIARPYRLAALLECIDHVLASRGASHVSSGEIDPVVATALDCVIRRHRDPLLAADIARAAGVSTDHLARAFKTSVGMSVKDYMLRLRVAVARRFLVDTEDPLDQVAERCGFSDVSHFSRVFLEYAGARPGLYRRLRAHLSAPPEPLVDAAEETRLTRWLPSGEFSVR